jgi:hypothetical protein
VDAPAAGSRRSFASLLALAATRQQQAGPLLALLLEAGANPTLASTATGAALQPSTLPLAEAAAAGCLEAVAHLLRWAADQRCSRLQLGWPAAAAAAARRSLRSDSCHEALCLLLDAWEQQQQQAVAEVAPGVGPEACRAIVAALLEAHLQQQTTLGAAVLVSGCCMEALCAAGAASCSVAVLCQTSTFTTHSPRLPAFPGPRCFLACPACLQDLDAACELQAVLLAERLVHLDIAADFAARLPDTPFNR